MNENTNQTAPKTFNIIDGNTRNFRAENGLRPPAGLTLRVLLAPATCLFIGFFVHGTTV